MAFLFEACVIGLLGVILGMAIAAAAAFTVVPLLFDVPGSLPLQWAGIAISICLAISLLVRSLPRPARLQHGPCRGSEERVRAYFYSGSHLSHYCRIASVDIVSYNS
jgi:membrane protein implicated in regulation of membrane protease activity